MADDKRHDVMAKLNCLFCSYGFELYPFKMGWYNETVGSSFRFDLHDDTLAFALVSTPDMFEKALIPFICRDDCTGSLDPLDKCVQRLFSQVKEEFSKEEVETIHDFEMTPMRRAKVLVQPAGHVSGAAYYYTRKDLDPDPFPKEKSIFGVSVHPKFGGWFAFRGVIIFKSIQSPNLPRTEPIDCVPSQEKRKELLELFNFHWQDCRYRDVIQVVQKYSPDQINYFNTLPRNRKPLIDDLRERYKSAQASS